MKTCIYLRKSRSDEEAEKQGEFETLSRHRSTLLKVAKEQNLNIVEIKEELVSGESIAYRPKMLELLEEVKNNFYDSVLVMDIDRLGRGNMQDQGLILETLKKSKTKIITPRKTYDLTNEFDEEYSEFEAFMARKELKLITRRMQRGRIKSVEEGKFIASKPPYGYKFTFDENGKKSMVIDEEKANVVKLIFKLYTDGNGASKVANHLNSLGLKTTTGRSWYEKGVRDIIKNKTYAGYVVWNKIERTKTSSKPRSQDEIIESKGLHDPIISEDIWNKAQRVLKGNAILPTPVFKEITNPLAGLIICRCCGHKMLARSSTSKNVYEKFIRCTNCGMNRGSKLYIVEEEVIKQLREWVKVYKTNFKNIPSIDNSNSNLDAYNKLLKNLNSEYETLVKQKENLHNLLEQGIYDVDTYLDRSKTLTDKIETNKFNIESVKKDIAKEQKVNVSIDDIIPSVEDVLDLYYKTDLMSERNDLLRSVIDYIDYYKEPGSKKSKLDIVINPKLD
ncbi:recombinase family protein [Paraclostridium benzoelyticum]|nr:recombinase family protein [Paraclostridium benzoelyticum]